jgi:hypothetical protein
MAAKGRAERHPLDREHDADPGKLDALRVFIDIPNASA